MPEVLLQLDSSLARPTIACLQLVCLAQRQTLCEAKQNVQQFHVSDPLQLIKSLQLCTSALLCILAACGHHKRCCANNCNKALHACPSCVAIPIFVMLHCNLSQVSCLTCSTCKAGGCTGKAGRALLSVPAACCKCAGQLWLICS